MFEFFLLILIIVTEKISECENVYCYNWPTDKMESDVDVRSKLCSQRKCFMSDPYDIGTDSRLKDITFAEIQIDSGGKFKELQCAFYSMPNLEVIDGSQSQISDVFVKAFVNLPQLRTLTLAFNKIQVLRSGFIVNAPSLEVLDLSWNKLHRIGQGVFNGMNLKILDLSRNELTHFNLDEDIGTLDKLILSHNYLKTIGQRASDWIAIPKVLDLSFNLLIDQPELHCSDKKYDCSVNEIDLTHNYIEIFNNRAFHGYRVDILRVGFNLLQNAFGNYSELLTQHFNLALYLPVKRISIYPNPWTCKEGWSNMFRILNHLKIETVPPETDTRFNFNYSYPSCIADNDKGLENYKEVVEGFVVDRGVQCSDDYECPTEMICRNGMCGDPCKYKGCNTDSEICVVKEHMISCKCPKGEKKNPYVPFSRCYNVECFVDSDCEGSLKCRSRTCE